MAHEARIKEYNAQLDTKQKEIAALVKRRDELDAELKKAEAVGIGLDCIVLY